MVDSTNTIGFGLKSQKNKKEPWWSYHPPDLNKSGSGKSYASLFMAALGGLGPLLSGSRNGYPIDFDLSRKKDDMPELVGKWFPDFKLVASHLHGGRNDRHNVHEYIYASDDGMLSIDIFQSENPSCSLSMNTRNPEHMDKLYEFSLLHLKDKTVSPGRIEAIVRPSADKPMKLIRAGSLVDSITTDNYTPEVIKGFESVVKDIKSKSPRGRIAIFDGPPGTGKTYLVRALTMAIPNARFVVVPSDLIEKIGSPEMTNLLIGISDDDDYDEDIVDKGTTRTVLLVEDADVLLNHRQSSNMIAIANALNIGDGIMGEVFDLFIVATTNTPLDEIDSAMKRPGRLSAIVTVKALPVEQAKAVFNRLLPDVPAPEWDEPKTLAEIYSAARDAGWEKNS